MTIQLIDTVTPDVGLKTVADKLNANFTNADHAASKLVGTASTEVPLNSDLGTAATANVQTSPTDTTAGALMAVGAFGLGGLGPTRLVVNANTLEYGIASQPIDGTSTNIPEAANGTISCRMWDTSGAGVQTFSSFTTGTTYQRFKIANTWQATWQPVYTGANYQPELGVAGLGVVVELWNQSGGSIPVNGTVSGALMTGYSKTTDGTIATGVALSGAHIYENVGAVAVATNRTGNFVRRT